jgi:alkyl hydroperoxide reductase subunit D
MKPVDVPNSNPDVQRSFERLQETLELGEVPMLFRLLGNHPALLNDFQMNLRKHVWSAGKLDAKTKALLGFSVASHKGCEVIAEFLAKRAIALGYSAADLDDATAITATCAMYNTLFKFRDLSGAAYYGGLPVGLRAHTFSSPVHSEAVVELINIVISDLNGCKPCITGHLEKARQLDLGDDAIYEAVQAAATVMHAVAYLQSSFAPD